MTRSAPPAAPRPEARSFRAACGHYPTGVAVVTARDSAGTLAAITVNAFVPVSEEARIVAVCVGSAVSSAPILADAERMTVHVLHDDQIGLASRVATSGLTGEQRLADVSWGLSAVGTPRLEEYCARLAGTVVERWPGGDHTVYLIEVDEVDVAEEALDGLGFYQGRFVRLAPAPAPAGVTAGGGEGDR